MRHALGYAAAYLVILAIGYLLAQSCAVPVAMFQAPNL